MEDFVEQDISSKGQEIYDLIERLYPICRSITGNGVRETLEIIGEYIPIDVYEVPTGTEVFDWKVPKEWNIQDAYIKNSKGERVIDFKKSNLHVLGYSAPVNEKLTLAELQPHLFSLPDFPEWIPYLTTYYKENWGFCLAHNQLETLKDDIYEVRIDSSLKDGSLTYGELYIPGRREEEILFSSYLCHPSLCNDNLSGIALLAVLAKTLLSKEELQYSYRFLFIPETIGAITWLSLNEEKVANIKCGLVATCAGDSGNPTYKKSRAGDTIIDRTVEKVLEDSAAQYEIVDFFPTGSDERQFCSPGFNMAVGSLMRTMYARFDEYHTSADNLDYVNSESLEDSLFKYLMVVFILENNEIYINTSPKCEPQLGKRGLYSMIGGQKKGKIDTLALLWVLNLADGENALLDIAIRSKQNFTRIKQAADALVDCGLLKKLH